MNSFELKAVTKTFTEFSSDVWQNTNEKQTGAYINYFLDPHGYPAKPDHFGSTTRGAVGKLQTLVVAAQTEHFKLADKLDEMEKAMKLMDTSVRVFQAISERRQDIRDIQQANMTADHIVAHIEWANDTFQAATEFGLDILNDTEDAVSDAMPDTTIVGMANGQLSGAS